MFKDVRCNAFSFIIQLLFPRPQPCSFSKLLTPPLFSPVIATRASEPPEKNQSRIITRRDFIQPIFESHLLEKFQKFGGILKSVEDSASKSVDTNSFFSRKGVPLNRHAHSSRLGPPEDGPRSIRGGGCCERGGRKRNGSCPVSRIAEWRVRATRLEVIRAICRRSSQVDRGRPGRDPALTSIRRPVARAHLTRINLETESRPRFTVQVQVQGS